MLYKQNLEHSEFSSKVLQNKISMKHRISCTPSQAVSTKNIKLLSHYKKEASMTEFEDITQEALEEEMAKSFTSTTSDCRLVAGDFGKHRPITEPGPSSVPFVGEEKAPLYEDVSDAESGTFNYEDIEEEERSNAAYMAEVEWLLEKSRRIVDLKSVKKKQLLKQVKWHKNKIKKVEKAIENLEKIIKYAKRLPQVLNSHDEL